MIPTGADETLALPGRIAVGSLQAGPEECVFIGDTETDLLAGLLGGVAVIGYSNKPGKAETKVRVGAAVEA
jgi:beta-phosphoglucomutase-like phosphatase (HAD superfamily)